MSRLLKIKRVEMQDEVLESAKRIEITKQDIDRLNRDIVAGCRKKEIENDKAVEKLLDKKIRW